MHCLCVKTLFIGFVGAFALAACGGGGSAGGGESPNEPSRLTVAATLPVDTAVGAVPTAPIQVTFSAPIQASTVTADSFTLTGPEGPVAGSFEILAGAGGPTAVTFRPNAALAFDRQYTVRLTSAITDTAGNPLVPYEWRFNTGKRIAAGASHTCVRFDDGRLKCWGRIGFGQLGIGDTALNEVAIGDQPNEMGNKLLHVDLGSGRAAVQIVAGAAHTCARLDDGKVKCWGDNASGQLGLGDREVRGGRTGQMGDNLPAVDLGSGRSALEITAGAKHTCVRLDNGQVKCWGTNTEGQLGIGQAAQIGDGIARGDQPDEMGDKLRSVELGSGRRAVQIAAGSSHTCARLDNGQVKCWGVNDRGQLGVGDKANVGDQSDEMGDNLVAADLGAGRQAIEVAAGGRHTCARLDNDSVKCWGDNEFGQLGIGDNTNDRAAIGDQFDEMGAKLPVVDFGSGLGNRGLVAESIVLGEAHTCVRFRQRLVQIGASSAVKCWGRNDFGQLGIGNITGVFVALGDQPNEMGNNLPVVQLGTDFSLLEVVAGGNHNCVRSSDGRIKCWGRNDSGQLGLGNTNNHGDAISEVGDLLPPVDLGN